MKFIRLRFKFDVCRAHKSNGVRVWSVFQFVEDHGEKRMVLHRVLM